MEKLKKLSEFKSCELNSKEMSLFKGAEKVCTGGGFESEYCSDGNGGYVLYSTSSWTSDYTEDGLTYYRGYNTTFGDC